MNEKLEKIKEHVKENKKTYIAGTAGFIAGGLLLSKVKTIQNIEIGFKWKSPTTNIMQTVMVRRGHPGNVIMCIETGQKWPSQNLAAKETGVNAGQLAQHLRGKHKHVKGLHFKKLGEAVKPQN